MYDIVYVCGSRICIYAIYDGGAWNKLDDDDCSYAACLYVYEIIWEAFLLHMFSPRTIAVTPVPAVYNVLNVPLSTATSAIVKTLKVLAID